MNWKKDWLEPIWSMLVAGFWLFVVTIALCYVLEYLGWYPWH